MSSMSLSAAARWYAWACALASPGPPATTIASILLATHFPLSLPRHTLAAHQAKEDARLQHGREKDGGQGVVHLDCGTVGELRATSARGWMPTRQKAAQWAWPSQAGPSMGQTAASQWRAPG